MFGLTHEQYVTLLPKSITTAIGMGISEELGGIVTISVAVIVLTGIFGNIMAEYILKWFHITDSVAMGEVEGAMSGLSIAVAGMITVIGANIFSIFY